MNPFPDYTDAAGRRFHYTHGRRVYENGGKDLGTRVDYVPTPPVFLETDFKPEYLSLAKAVHDSGFIAAQYPDRLQAWCCSPNTDPNAVSHGLWIAVQTDCWYVGTWAGRFYRGRDRGRLSELCLLLLNHPPGVNTATRSCVDYPLPDEVIRRFGLKQLRSTHTQEEKALKPGYDGYGVNFGLLRTKFGFWKWSASEGDRALENARSAMEKAWEKPVPVKPKRVYLNDDLIYLPSPFFSCSSGVPTGFLYERSTGRGRTLRGEGHVAIWAYYRLGAWNDHRTVTLAITAIHDRGAVESLLRPDRGNNAGYETLKRRLADPPHTAQGLKQDELNQMTWLLYQAEEQNWFDFEVRESPS